RLRIVVLFAWSPLLIFEAIGNGHNDIVMMACVLAAFCLMLRGRAQLAFALLVLGALIKYVSAVFVPLWLVYELHQRARKKESQVNRRPYTALPEGRQPRDMRSRMWDQVRVMAHSLDQLDRHRAF